ncbi:hypothetical protein [Streptomyces ambofaciens]|uniref:hypothetical protein n=1 Tax=Streptomyces ambofaciens TaxID=1889 RepID=UPI00069EF95E|nr:hypothetical protein [Streptomyces ambofaciens]
MPQQQRMSRLTLDLDRQQHRKLKAWSQQAAENVGLVDVPMAVVLRWLVATLTMEPDDDEYSLLAREIQRAVLEHLRDPEALAQNRS